MWGGYSEYGKYSVKLYTIYGVLIYQDDIGGDNTGKTPKGGVVFQRSLASSMLDAINNPITFYGSGAVINHAGHSRDLYDYYWTSYSRGTDGTESNSKNNFHWHNDYLDGYITLRAKSIYDPCPYSYRIPSNGTWNQFTNHPLWTVYSYIGGVAWNILDQPSWLAIVDERTPLNFIASGRYSGYRTSTVSAITTAYTIEIGYDSRQLINAPWSRSSGYSVRCIEDCDPTKKRMITQIRL